MALTEGFRVQNYRALIDVTLALTLRKFFSDRVKNRF
jgi:hypothetical protein